MPRNASSWAHALDHSETGRVCRSIRCHHEVFPLGAFLSLQERKGCKCDIYSRCKKSCPNQGALLDKPAVTPSGETDIFLANA